MCAKFDHSIFSRYGYIIGANQNLNGLRNLTTPRIICHAWDSACYDQPIYHAN